MSDGFIHSAQSVPTCRTCGSKLVSRQQPRSIFFMPNAGGTRIVYICPNGCSQRGGINAG